MYRSNNIELSANFLLVNTQAANYYELHYVLQLLLLQMMRTCRV